MKMTHAFYLRNDQFDATAPGYTLYNDQVTVGVPAKTRFEPNWKELMANGEDGHRRLQPGDALVVVNKTPEVFPDGTDPLHVAERMFQWYNRKGVEMVQDGGGNWKPVLVDGKPVNVDPEEREFEGPSLSVGDLVVVKDFSGKVTVLQCASCGYVEVPAYPELLTLVA